MNEIRKQLPKSARFPTKRTGEIAEALALLPSSEGIWSWPSKKPLFWNRSVADAVASALPAVLDTAPLTLPGIAAALKRAIPKLTAAQLRAEASGQLRTLAARSEILQAGQHYCGPGYLRGFLPADHGLAHSVASAIAELETARGNYVAIGKLREAPAFRKAIDQAILDAARDPAFVLARYDGPAPDPADQVALLDAGDGLYYVGIARAREGGAQ